MGRWGHRLFEGDTDLDLALEIGEGTKAELSKMVHQTDMCADDDVKEYYQTSEYKEILTKKVEDNRQILDAGVCDELFKKYRAKKDDFHGEYPVIILGALMMRAGAKIKQDDLNHLRAVVPRIPSRSAYALPISAMGFRDPGKIQFLKALEKYKNGEPRDFGESSCFNCGAVNSDLEEGHLLACGRCRAAHYCGKECQVENWEAHKPICSVPGTRFMLNV